MKETVNDGRVCDGDCSLCRYLIAIKHESITVRLRMMVLKMELRSTQDSFT